MHNTLYDNLERRILLLDGGFGTMVQGYGLGEAEYRGERFRDWSVPLKGCNDLLALTRPEVVREIHEKYLQAGADIIETDSFNANAVSLRDYGLEAYAGEMARAAAAVARAAADAATARNPQKPRFVAGSMGPTNRTASMSADVANPASREITFRELVDAYTTQAQGLLDGGVDILLVETVFDTLNAKAALYAIDLLAERLGREIPVMVSGTPAAPSRDRPSRPSASRYPMRGCSPWGSTAPTGRGSCCPTSSGLRPWPRHASRPTPTPDCRTSWAATTRRPRCLPRMWANTCAAAW